MEVLQRTMAAGGGTNSASATIGPFNETPVARNLWFTSPGTGTLVIYRAGQKALANAAVVAATTLVIKTDASGYVGGSALTTSDYVLVMNSATGTWYLASISSVAAVSSSTVSLGLGSAISCAADDLIYIVRAADIVTFVTGTETVSNLQYAFNGYRGYPIRVVLTATGTCRFGVAVDVEA